jgi:hypothetical protein
LETFLFGGHAFDLETLVNFVLLKFVIFVDSQLELILDLLNSFVTFLNIFRPKDEVSLQGFPALLENVDP